MARLLHPDKNPEHFQRAYAAFRILKVAHTIIRDNVDRNGGKYVVDKANIVQFAAINLEPELQSMKLPPLSYYEAISFFQNFLIENQTFLYENISDSDLKKDLQLFSHKLDTLLDSVKFYDSIKVHLAVLESTTSEKRQEFNKQISPLVKKIFKLQPQQSLLLPGHSGAHNYIYEFQKDLKGDLIFIVYTPTKGLMHHKPDYHADREQFESIICYSVKAENFQEDKLQFFLAELYTAEFTDVDLYKSVFPKISYLRGVEIDPNSLEERGINIIPRVTRGHDALNDI